MGLTGFDSKVNVCVSMSWKVVYPRKSGTSTFNWQQQLRFSCLIDRITVDLGASVQGMEAKCLSKAFPYGV